MEAPARRLVVSLLALAVCSGTKAEDNGLLTNTGSVLQAPEGSQLWAGSLTSLDYGSKLAVGDFAAGRVSVHKQDDDGTWLVTPELELNLEEQGLTSLAALDDDTLVVGLANKVHLHPLDPESGYHSAPEQVIEHPDGSEFFGSSIALLPNQTVAIADWGKQVVSLYRRLNISDPSSSFELVQSIVVAGAEFGRSLASLPEGGLAVGDTQASRVYIFNRSSSLPLQSKPSSVIEAPSGSVSFAKSLSYVNGLLIVGDPSAAIRGLEAYTQNVSTKEYIQHAVAESQLQPYAMCALSKGRVAVGDFKTQQVAIWQVSSQANETSTGIGTDAGSAKDTATNSEQLALDDAEELLIELDRPNHHSHIRQH